MEISSVKEFEDNFKKTFFEEVKPLLGSYDKERVSIIEQNKKANRNMVFWLIGIFFAFLLITIYLFKHYMILNIIFIVYIAIGFVIFTVLFNGCIKYTAAKNYEDKLKERFMPDLMKAFGIFEWKHEMLISAEELEKSNLYKRVSYKFLDDNFIGIYRGVEILISEFHFFYSLKNNKKNRRVFKGLIVMLECNKKFNGQTLISYKSGYKSKEFPAKFERVNLEKSQFDDYYECFSENQVEARYLVTTAFMERFANLAEVFKTHKIEASFYDNKLLIAIDFKRDLFKLGDLNKSVEDIKPYKKMFNEFISILEIVDCLKLNQKIGL